MTTALLAAIFFYGNQTTAMHYMNQHQGTYELDKSQFNRRLARLHAPLWAIVRAVGQTLKEFNTTSRYLLDSFPVAVCDHIRIKTCQLVKSESCRSYSASKR